MSAIRDGQAALVAGPYGTHANAAGDIDRVRNALTAPLQAEQAQAFAWGVSESPQRCDGLANASLGFRAAI